MASGREIVMPIARIVDVRFGTPPLVKMAEFAARFVADPWGS
jgi:hypothetical protein